MWLFQVGGTIKKYNMQTGEELYQSHVKYRKTDAQTARNKYRKLTDEV